MAGGLNGRGCTGRGRGWICLDGLDQRGKGIGPVTTGNGPEFDYAFVLDITVRNGALFDDPEDTARIKGRYVREVIRTPRTRTATLLTATPPVTVVRTGDILSEPIVFDVELLEPTAKVPVPGSLALLGPD